LSDEKPAFPEPGEEVNALVWLAYASIGFTAAAFIFLGVTLKTDNVLLFNVVALMSLLGLVTGVMHRCNTGSFQVTTFFSAILSGLLIVISTAFLVVLGLWDSNL